MKRVGIVGASGYTGYELIKLLSAHGGVELAALESESSGGQPVSSVYPEFTGDLKYTRLGVDRVAEMKLDCVFLAMHEGFARETVVRLNAPVIDLSRDFRLDTHAAYGLPEYFRDEIRTARLVSNPGCYVTSCLLAVLPLVKEGLLDRVVLDAKSGYSGAGRTPSYGNDPRNYTDNIIPYKPTAHPHRAEICRFLGTNVSFTPHVLPTFRGILSTCHVFTTRPVTMAGVRHLFEERYRNEPCLRVLGTLPELHDVQGTNLCALGGFEVDDSGRLVVFSAIDNLIKGASGQAVQNMNLMLGFPETQGLPLGPLHRALR